jgi:hypothetical protein
LQNPSQTDGVNQKNVRRETSITLEKKEGISEKNKELETNSKSKNVKDLYRGIN